MTRFWLEWIFAMFLLFYNLFMNVFILGFQLALLALVLLSFLMLILVPVVFASPDGLTNNKNYILLSVVLWSVLVLTVGVLNFFVV